MPGMGRRIGVPARPTNVQYGHFYEAGPGHGRSSGTASALRVVSGVIFRRFLDLRRNLRETRVRWGHRYRNLLPLPSTRRRPPTSQDMPPIRPEAILRVQTTGVGIGHCTSGSGSVFRSAKYYRRREWPPPMEPYWSTSEAHGFSSDRKGSQSLLGSYFCMYCIRRRLDKRP